VAAGLSWWNKKFARKDRRLEELQAAARAARRGLWRDRNPVPPWKHRAHYRSPRRH
jgi:endonuclease YncB( thermonuclease family)